MYTLIKNHMKEQMVNMVVITVISSIQRLAGATLLVFANKQDLPGALSKEAIREVRFTPTANAVM